VTAAATIERLEGEVKGMGAAKEEVGAELVKIKGISSQVG